MKFRGFQSFAKQVRKAGVCYNDDLIAVLVQRWNRCLEYVLRILFSISGTVLIAL